MNILLVSAVLLSCLATARCAMVDLTYQFVPGGVMPQYPMHTPYSKKQIIAGPLGQLDWVAINDISMGEHIGTHMDAPYHFHADGMKIHEIPLERFHGAAVVIDITARAELDSNAAVSVEDLQNWETQHGRIPDGAWIIMNSGWGKYWNDPIKFVGTLDITEALEKIAFPGFSPEAAQWLLDNRPTVSGMAVDTVSCDTGHMSSRSLPTLIKWLGQGKLCLENLAFAEKIPAFGAELHALPLLLQNGTGSPTRAYATWGLPCSQVPPGGSSFTLVFVFLVVACCGYWALH